MAGHVHPRINTSDETPKESERIIYASNKKGGSYPWKPSLQSTKLRIPSVG
jgi:hypothetical protein